MNRRAGLETLGLKYNPFPPAATGAAFGETNWIPDSWADEIAQSIQDLSFTEGAKAIAIVGALWRRQNFPPPLDDGSSNMVPEEFKHTLSKTLE